MEFRLVQLIGAELACLVEKKYFLMLAIGIIGVSHMHTHTYRERERENEHALPGNRMIVLLGFNIS